MKQNFQNLDQFEYWNLIREIGSFNDKWEDSVATKSEIFNRLIKNLNQNSITILFPRFNPIALHLARAYSVSVIGPVELSTIFDMTNIKLYPSVDAVTQKYDVVLALDEYFTLAIDEQDQRNKLEETSKLTNGWLITTLQDYKNFAPHKKNQIEAVSINSEHNYIMLENSIADKKDKQLWYHYWCCIKDHNELLSFGPSTRRTMYFKQLAKYSSDVGSKQYVIQKNLLYKGFFSKMFEHIITVNF